MSSSRPVLALWNPVWRIAPAGRAFDEISKQVVPPWLPPCFGNIHGLVFVMWFQQTVSLELKAAGSCWSFCWMTYLGKRLWVFFCTRISVVAVFLVAASPSIADEAGHGYFSDLWWKWNTAAHEMVDSLPVLLAVAEWKQLLQLPICYGRNADAHEGGGFAAEMMLSLDLCRHTFLFLASFFEGCPGERTFMLLIDAAAVVGGDGTVLDAAAGNVGGLMIPENI
ncbi:hypothetical protein Nepgr_006646 [Nepenthes gracilis]|uniref:Uncharacterized protein n=1 Tax=Nepenthes gracilis TaxID=150966 RepID=A0AAD3S5Y0_NEPGR|nr:hypothetical protein Nepgr_006646 [Nepenthes gracilis]